MNNKLIKTLLSLPGVTGRSGASGQVLASLSENREFRLPPSHRELLLWSNGVSAFDGYFRIFGTNTTPDEDVIRWNDRSCWKFAWGNRCDSFWCFGLTGWGDQYAYRLDDLIDGNDRVFFLDALSMSAELIASSFESFISDEFLRNAQYPYDEKIVEARKAFGVLEAGYLLAYSPSPLIGGSEDISNVQRMPARAAMICNGDLAQQLDEGPEGGEISCVQAYQDKAGRSRIQIIWK